MRTALSRGEQLESDSHTDSRVRAIVKTCGSGVSGGGGLVGALDELAVAEDRSGADEGDEVGAVDGAPAALG